MTVSLVVADCCVFVAVCCWMLRGGARCCVALVVLFGVCRVLVISWLFAVCRVSSDVRCVLSVYCFVCLLCGV